MRSDRCAPDRRATTWSGGTLRSVLAGHSGVPDTRGASRVAPAVIERSAAAGSERWATASAHLADASHPRSGRAALGGDRRCGPARRTRPPPVLGPGRARRGHRRAAGAAVGAGRIVGHVLVLSDRLRRLRTDRGSPTIGRHDAKPSVATPARHGTPRSERSRPRRPSWQLQHRSHTEPPCDDRPTSAIQQTGTSSTSPPQEGPTRVGQQPAVCGPSPPRRRPGRTRTPPPSSRRRCSHPRPAAPAPGSRRGQIGVVGGGARSGALLQVRAQARVQGLIVSWQRIAAGRLVFDVWPAFSHAPRTRS